MQYRLIASDLDGTMFGDDLTPPKANVDSIQRAMDAGVKVVIATGRPPSSTQMVANKLGIVGEDQYLICFNGAAIARASDGAVLESTFLPDDAAEKIMAVAHRFDTSVIAYINGVAHSRRETEDTYQYGQRVKRPVVIDESFDQKWHTNYHKVVILDDPSVLSQIEAEVLALVGDQVDYIYSTPTLLEFICKGVSKGNALLQLAKNLSLAQAELVAVGDYYNDVSMIEAAGLGVAIQGAPMDIQNLAQYVTERSAAEGAISEVIEKFIL